MTLALDTSINPYTLDIKYHPSGIPQGSKVSELPENTELYTMFTPKAEVGSPLAIKNRDLAKAEGDNIILRGFNSFVLKNWKGGMGQVIPTIYEATHEPKAHTPLHLWIALRKWWYHGRIMKNVIKVLKTYETEISGWMTEFNGWTKVISGRKRLIARLDESHLGLNKDSQGCKGGSHWFE
ncbi:hypothetical protein SERLA73DRAFT_183123 [Serpula lacrymans var. lacrymans S7.3]|uniref:Uncharacterized protein n=2 Tax=Serpula lacrymans var. lacrymans TaxID=341189 RepID=F8Q1M7_SERL3|nr:uncharacterized protein SERLADRAFT_470129 [Serpula lacrymans var. lacrymans S7.9]EGN98205.1 hypothetical protein SERLA73DRAFT_183123 [Serpula lacrymans var. lacrymans S7.3]EGO23782.1 hypothetical protein SERLADRAFT_470129 [Serpula lacrymans var. lacrymans S7.9]